MHPAGDTKCVPKQKCELELEMLRFTVDALFGLVSGSKITWLGLGEDLG